MATAYNWADVDPRAKRITVYYEGTSTLYEGSPVCYNWDTTTNWSNVARSATTGGTYNTTTAEGYQNESKWIRVEDPATANLGHFAGVVAKGSKGIGEAGPNEIDIYIANGAIVPVYTDVSTTVGQSVLGITNGQVLLQGGGRPVAIAQETADRSSDNGIVLACLDDTLFSYQKNGSTNLLHTVLTGGVINDNRADFAHTSSYASHSLDFATFSGTLAATGGGSCRTVYLGITGSITATTSYTRAFLGQLVVSGTINGSNAHLAAGHFQLGGSPTFTACSKISALWADIGLGVTPTSGDVCGLRISNNGTNQTEVTHGIELYGGYGINKLFKFDTCAGITANFISNGGTGGAETGITSGGDWKKLKVDIDGTDYYLLAMLEPVEVDMVS